MTEPYYEDDLPTTVPIEDRADDGHVDEVLPVVESTIDVPLTLGGVLADLAEKGLKTFAQVLLTFLAAGATVSALDVPWSLALQGAAIATIATVLLATLTIAWQTSNPYVEILLRASRTFIAAFAGALPVVDATSAVTLADVPWGQAAAMAGTLALVSVLTSIGSLKIGPVGSPSLVR